MEANCALHTVKDRTLFILALKYLTRFEICE